MLRMYFFDRTDKMNSEMNNAIKIQEFIKDCTGPIPDELKFEGW